MVELSLPNWDSEEENAQTTTQTQGQGKGKEGNASSLHTLRFLYDDEGNEISRLSNLGFILNQQFNEMNLPIRQRAGHEPRTHFDTTELRLTGIDSPSFAELNRTYQYDKALNTIATNDEIEDLKFVVNGNNQITQVISQYQTREIITTTKTVILVSSIFTPRIIVTTTATHAVILPLITTTFINRATNSTESAISTTAMTTPGD